MDAKTMKLISLPGRANRNIAMEKKITKEDFKRLNVPDGAQTLDEVLTPFADGEVERVVSSCRALNTLALQLMITRLSSMSQGNDLFERYGVMQTYFESEVGFATDNTIVVKACKAPAQKTRWVNTTDRRLLFPVLAEACKDAARAKAGQEWSEARANKVCGFIDDYMAKCVEHNYSNDWWLPGTAYGQ